MAVAGAVALGALLKSTTLSTKRNLVNLGEGRSSAARGGDDGRGGDDRLNKPADDGKDNKEKWSSRKRMVKVLSWPLRQSKLYKEAQADAESSDDEDDLGNLVVESSEPLEMPTLFETCATVILSHVNLSSRLEEYTPFNISDLFLMLGPAGSRVKGRLESSTLSLRGNCQPTLQLCNTIKSMSMHFANLGVLCLDRASGVTDGLINKFLITSSGKPLLPTAHTISLADTAVGDYGVKRLLAAYGHRLRGICLNNTACTHKMVKAMAKVNPNLESIGLSYFSVMRDRHVLRLVQHCRKIKELDLSYCLMLTDESAGAMPGLYFLQTLNISYNENIGTGIKALSRNPFLRSLRLQNCRRVPNLELQEVIRNCTLLDNLCIRGCPMLNLGIVKTCAQHCIHLRALDVAGCPQINGNRALAVLARGQTTRETIKDFASTQRVVMHASPLILDLYALNLPDSSPVG